MTPSTATHEQDGDDGIPADNVARSSPYKQEERETHIHLTRADDGARVESFDPAVTRRLLKYPHFTPLTAYVLAGERPKRVSVDEYGGQDIIGVSGTVPVGALKLGTNVRNSGGHAEVVSDCRGYDRGDDE